VDLYLRGQEDGDLNLNRLSFRTRDEYARQRGVFVFGQVEYLRDTFKNLQYLVAPTFGVGYRVADTPALAFDFDAGIGVKVEKSPYVASQTSAAITAGQRFLRKLSDSATITQSVAALWTVDDFGDALYTVKAGLAANLTSRSQIKVEVVDLFKTRPPVVTVGKNDVSVVTALVYKF
jgi:putative salt-induced outer membrane protein YdiY